MQDSLRFNKPIECARPRGAHRLEAFSPKLGRRLSLYSRATFELWLCHETDPAVKVFCERPGLVQLGEKQRLAEFWVRYADREEIVVLGEPEGADTDSLSPQRLIDSELKCRIVRRADLAATRMWVANWERMLPCVVANRRLLSRALLDAIVRFVTDPVQLSTIEREFSTGDLVPVRTAVLTLLHGGRLRAP